VGLPLTYTLRELVARSGFDKRTIAYYIQESLLPRVGRRGRSTRYPEEFLDRLMFIRRVRDLQDAGGLRAVTLSEIRQVIDGQSAEETRRTSRKGVSAEFLRGLFVQPDLEPSGYVVAAEDMAPSAMLEMSVAEKGTDRLGDAERPLRMSVGMRREAMASRGRARGGSEARSPESPSDPELRTLLREVERRARRGAKGSEGQTRERLTRVPITDEILLSVRNISDKDSHLVEELAALLRRIGRLD